MSSTRQYNDIYEALHLFDAGSDNTREWRVKLQGVPTDTLTGLWELRFKDRNPTMRELHDESEDIKAIARELYARGRLERHRESGVVTADPHEFIQRKYVYRLKSIWK